MLESDVVSAARTTSTTAEIARLFARVTRASAGAATASETTLLTTRPAEGHRPEGDEARPASINAEVSILALAGDRIVRGRANKAEAQKPDGARNVDGNRLLCDADLDGARRG